MTPRETEALRGLLELENELHRCWQRMEQEARLVRHTTLEMLKLINVLKGRE